MCARKFCKKILDPYSSVREYIARASPPSLAPPTAAEEYCALAALERPIMKKKEDARLAVLREYDRWAKDQGQTFLISVPSAANGKPFMAGFVTEVD